MARCWIVDSSIAYAVRGCEVENASFLCRLFSFSFTRRSFCMLRTHFSFRRWGFSGILFGLLVASLVGGLVVRGHLTSARAATNPAKYAFIVFLDGGHPELYNATNTPFLTS